MTDNAQLIADLDALDALFSDESKWTKHATARAVNNAHVGYNSSTAVCWCLIGGIAKVSEDIYSRRFRDLSIFIRKIAEKGPAKFNDAPETTFATIKALITIARQRAQEGAGS